MNEQPDMADGQPENIMLLLTLLVGKCKMTSLDSTTQKTWGIPCNFVCIYHSFRGLESDFHAHHVNAGFLKIVWEILKKVGATVLPSWNPRWRPPAGSDFGCPL